MNNYKNKLFAIVLLSLLSGVFFCSNSFAKTVSGYFGRESRSGYNYNQCQPWISGWDSCNNGCGHVTLATAYSYVRGGVTPATMWKKASSSVLNNGMNGNDFKRYAKKVGLSVSSVGSVSALASALYAKKVVALWVNRRGASSGHWLTVYKAKFSADAKTSKGKTKYSNWKVLELCVSDPGHSEFRGRCISVSRFKSRYPSKKGAYALN